MKFFLLITTLLALIFIGCHSNKKFDESGYKKTLLVEFSAEATDSIIISQLKPYAIGEIKRVSRSKNKWQFETSCAEMDCQNTIHQLTLLKNVLFAGQESSLNNVPRQQGMQKSKPISKKQ